MSSMKGYGRYGELYDKLAMEREQNNQRLAQAKIHKVLPRHDESLDPNSRTGFNPMANPPPRRPTPSELG